MTLGRWLKMVYPSGKKDGIIIIETHGVVVIIGGCR